MVTPRLHIIMPVKDSVNRAEEAIRAVLAAGQTLTVYNDYSTPENTQRLQQLAASLSFILVNLSDLTTHPSPNYLLVLQRAQQMALADQAHLVIVESDVVVRPDTFRLLGEQVEPGVGMVAAVTVNEQGNINYPYDYAHRWSCGVYTTKKRFSFCCTLITNEFLHAYDFMQLDPTKNWYDVFITHRSTALGLGNRLMTNNPVLHRPHSSRPWKLLKYKNPFLYYWRKLTQHKDRI